MISSENRCALLRIISWTTFCCRKSAISSAVKPNSASTSSDCSLNSGGCAGTLLGVGDSVKGWLTRQISRSSSLAHAAPPASMRPQRHRLLPSRKRRETRCPQSQPKIGRPWYPKAFRPSYARSASSKIDVAFFGLPRLNIGVTNVKLSSAASNPRSRPCRTRTPPAPPRSARRIPAAGPPSCSACATV
jgi:hypothetical protein